jgi:hypothetical protein
VPNGGLMNIDFPNIAGNRTFIFSDSGSLSDTIATNFNTFFGSDTFIQTVNLYRPSNQIISKG